LGVAGCNFVMGIPRSDDIMLNYQTTSFHDAFYARRALGLKPAPEFDEWLTRMEIVRDGDSHRLAEQLPQSFARSLERLPADAR
jgi:ethanolamine ammonia-lyase large subunit